MFSSFIKISNQLLTILIINYALTFQNPIFEIAFILNTFLVDEQTFPIKLRILELSFPKASVLTFNDPLTLELVIFPLSQKHAIIFVIKELPFPMSLSIEKPTLIYQDIITCVLSHSRELANAPSTFIYTTIGEHMFTITVHQPLFKLSFIISAIIAYKISFEMLLAIQPASNIPAAILIVLCAFAMPEAFLNLAKVSLPLTSTKFDCFFMTCIRFLFQWLLKEISLLQVYIIFICLLL